MPNLFTPSASAKKIELSFPLLLAAAKRRKFMTVSVICWLVMVVLFAVVVFPQVQTIYTNLTEVQTLQDELTSEQTRVQSLQSLNLPEITSANSVLSAAMPVEKPVLPLLYSVDRLATSAQVSLSNFEISPGLLGSGSAGLAKTSAAPSSISPNLSALPLRMDVGGSFDNLRLFFKSLDSVIPFIQVNSVQFSSASTGTDATGAPVSSASAKTATSSAQYTAIVNLSSLYLGAKPPVPADLPIVPLTTAQQALLDQLTQANIQRETDLASQVTSVATASASTSLFQTQ